MPSHSNSKMTLGMLGSACRGHRALLSLFCSYVLLCSKKDQRQLIQIPKLQQDKNRSEGKQGWSEQWNEPRRWDVELSSGQGSTVLKGGLQVGL